MHKALGNIFIWIALVLVQILICNHIMLFNVAIAFVFIYVILRLRIGLSPGWLLTWAFLSGFIIDIFSDTLGVNSLACTILAMCKRPMLFAYVPHDDRTKDIVPSIGTLGIAAYSKYLLSMVTTYCLLVFAIEYFNFADVKEIVIMTASSAVLTFVVLLGVDGILGKNPS